MICGGGTEEKEEKRVEEECHFVSVCYGAEHLSVIILINFFQYVSYGTRVYVYIYIRYG